MKLSTKSRYGTRAMAEIAKRYQSEPIKRKEITETQFIPDSYLENILVSLKESGLIRTIRGARGGYQLSRSPGEITILQIVESLEGPLRPVPCVDPAYVCKLQSSCVTQSIWEEMYQSMRKVLKQYTLEDLISRSSAASYQDFMI